jgi:plasmid stabilization system protein ParE
MVNRVEFTDDYLTELSNIINYLRNNASDQSSKKLFSLIDKQITQLESNLMEGRPVIARKTIRYVLVGKYYRMYYRKHGLTLYITHIFDTRQDPAKSPYN